MLWASFPKQGISDINEIAGILALSEMESGCLRYTEELPSRFASSKWRYKGRGVVQLTGTSSGPGNYAEYAKFMNRPDIVTNPEIVSSDDYLCVNTAFFYWKKSNQGQYAREGRWKDVRCLHGCGATVANKLKQKKQNGRFTADQLKLLAFDTFIATVNQYLQGKGPLWYDGPIDANITAAQPGQSSDSTGDTSNSSGADTTTSGSTADTGGSTPAGIGETITGQTGKVGEAYYDLVRPGGGYARSVEQVQKDQTNTSTEKTPTGATTGDVGESTNPAAPAEANSIIGKFINIAIRNAKSAKGYSQPMRMQPGWYDCSSLVGRSLQEAGIDICYKIKGGSLWAPTTVEMRKHYTKAGFTWHSRNITNADYSFLKPGDILLRELAVTGLTGHTVVYVGNGLVANAMGRNYGVKVCKLGSKRYNGFLRLGNGASASTAAAATKDAGIPTDAANPDTNNQDTTQAKPSDKHTELTRPTDTNAPGDAYMPAKDHGVLTPGGGIGGALGDVGDTPQQTSTERPSPVAEAYGLQKTALTPPPIQPGMVATDKAIASASNNMERIAGEQLVVLKQILSAVQDLGKNSILPFNDKGFNDMIGGVLQTSNTANVGAINTALQNAIGPMTTQIGNMTSMIDKNFGKNSSVLRSLENFTRNARGNGLPISTSHGKFRVVNT